MVAARKITYRIFYSAVVAVFLMSPCFVVSQVRSESVEKEPGKVSKQCEEKAKDETRWMTKNLYLSTEQYDKVKSLNLYYTCLMDGLSHISDKVMVSKKKSEIIKNKEAEFKAVLSQQQYEQYKSRKENVIVEKKSPFSGSL